MGLNYKKKKRKILKIITRPLPHFSKPPHPSPSRRVPPPKGSNAGRWRQTPPRPCNKRHLAKGRGPPSPMSFSLTSRGKLAIYGAAPRTGSATQTGREKATRPRQRTLPQNGRRRGPGCSEGKGAGPQATPTGHIALPPFSGVQWYGLAGLRVSQGGTIPQRGGGWGGERRGEGGIGTVLQSQEVGVRGAALLTQLKCPLLVRLRAKWAVAEALRIRARRTRSAESSRFETKRRHDGERRPGLMKPAPLGAKTRDVRGRLGGPKIGLESHQGAAGEIILRLRGGCIPGRNDYSPPPGFGAGDGIIGLCRAPKWIADLGMALVLSWTVRGMQLQQNEDNFFPEGREGGCRLSSSRIRCHVRFCLRLTGHKMTLLLLTLLAVLTLKRFALFAIIECIILCSKVRFSLFVICHPGSLHPFRCSG